MRFIYIRNKVLKMMRLILSVIVPIKKNRILFQSSPDYSDNARAFSDYIAERTDYEVIWSVDNPESYVNNRGVVFVRKDGGDSLWGKIRFAFLTASSHYLISTHAAFKFANKRKQTYVCCWHGMPLKRIAQLQDARNKDYLDNTLYILSTSSEYKPIIAKCFGKNENDILVTGYPRNDWLFCDSDVLKKIGVTRDESLKIIMYLPTFRKPQGGSYFDSDQDSFKDGPIDFMSDKCVLSLNETLKEMNVLLIVKPHPAETNQLSFKKLSNVFIVPHSFFLEKDIQLNKVLHYADALITDFSGAFIDYMNLNRPIGFVLTDINKYENNRGFVFSSPLDYMPGSKIYCEQDFVDFCYNVSKGDDRYLSERERLRLFYNDYSDSNNCKRLADILNL